MIKRYDLYAHVFGFEVGMHREPDGQWVEYEDLQPLLTAVSQAVCVVKLLPDGNCVLMKDDLDRLRALLDEVQGGRIETTETLYTR